MKQWSELVSLEAQLSNGMLAVQVNTHNSLISCHVGSPTRRGKRQFCLVKCDVIVFSTVHDVIKLEMTQLMTSQNRSILTDVSCLGTQNSNVT